MRPILAILALATVLAAAGCSCRQGDGVRLAADGSLDVTELAATFDAAGLTTRVFDERSLALSTPEGFHLIVFLEDGGSTLQALFPCVRDGDLLPGVLPAWNATRRFSRAYLDEDGRPVMGADLLLDGDTTREQVVAWGELLLAMAEAFMAEVWPPLPSRPILPEPRNE